MLGGLLRGREQRSVSAGEILRAINDRRMGGPSLEVSDPERAMRHSAVWACVRLIAGVGSTLPLDQFREVGESRSPMTLAPVLADPTPNASATTWRHQVWTSLLLCGNAYGLVTEFAANGWPRRVELLDPAVVQWRLVDGNRWEVHVDNRAMDRWPVGPLWHVAWFTGPGRPFGRSPIAHAAATIGAGLAAEEFGGRFFADGGHPSAILKSDQMLTAEQAQGTKDAFLKATRGTTREPMVMGSGLDYVPVQVSPDDSQFLDSQRFTVEQVARVYGVFPEMIGGASSGSSVTYANREQRAADWLTFGLVPYLVPVEEALTSLVPRPQRVKANVSALLRSDLKTRYESYEIAARIGEISGVPLLSVDEMRELEDRSPVPGGSTFTRRETPAPNAPPEVQE